MKQSWLRRSAAVAALVVVGLAVPLSTVSAAPGSWGEPTPLGGERPNTYGGNAAVVVSADGSRALAVWEGPNRSVQTASATISGSVETWGSVTTLTAADRRLLNSEWDGTLSIALSDDGATAMAVWVESDLSSANRQISAASASISGTTATWSTVTSVSGPQVSDPIMVYYPQIEISADGTLATAVWLRYSNDLAGSMTVESASAAISGGTATWSSESVIDGPYYKVFPSYYLDPSLGLSADGTKATLVWINGQDVDFATVKSASATITGNSASWSAPQSLTASSREVEAATVAVSADGTKAVATWRLETEASNGVRVVQSAAATISGNTATWGSVVPVDDGAYDGWEVHVALSSDGTKATVAWIGRYNENGDEAVKSASGTVSGTSVTWGATTLLSPATSSSPRYVGLELSADGTVAFAHWRAQDGNDGVCREAWATVDGTSATWDASTVIGPGTGLYPSVLRASLSDDGSRATSLCGAFDLSTNVWSYYTRSIVWERDGWW